MEAKNFDARNLNFWREPMEAEECCKEPDSCSKGSVTPECLVQAVEDALVMAKQVKEQVGRSDAGREASLAVTHLEDAMFRSYRCQNDSVKTVACS